MSNAGERSTGSRASSRRGRIRPAIPPRVRTVIDRAGRRAVTAGLPPGWFDHRWVQGESLAACLGRAAIAGAPATIRAVHGPAVAQLPLPRNVQDRHRLPADRGWWGYAMRDVPSRPCGETAVVTLTDCTIAWYHRADGDFQPAILTGDRRSLDVREIRFRPGHRAPLRRRSHRLARATWILERVYHNHAHWLTAHLPKLLVLEEHAPEHLAHVVLPPEPTPAMSATMAQLGLDPAAFPRWPGDGPLAVDELTIVVNDRFRPELLRSVHQRLRPGDTAPGRRRVFVSRAGAARRRLCNEEELWPILRRHGFERVRLEALSPAAQAELLADTAVLCGPHGAGLANMLLCPPGLQVVEIADLGFPNPNFYATAAAVGHDYWLVAGRAAGPGSPLERDLEVDPAALEAVVRQLPGSPAETTLPGR
ncbi:MAG: DUF563 domain-containing protein [Vicinamibacterales bacterium]